jgi:hypothetical protein
VADWPDLELDEVVLSTAIVEKSGLPVPITRAKR